MLDSQKTTISKLKEAFSLNAQDVNKILHELSPYGVFPYFIWEQAYSEVWRSSVIENVRLYKVEQPQFPDVGTLPEGYFPLETYATWMTNYFFELARLIPVATLEKGLDYILEAVYDSKDALSKADRDYIFYPLYLQEKNIANAARIQGLKDLSMNVCCPDVLHKIFPDTIVIDKYAALQHVIHSGGSYGKDVKGIPRALVERITTEIFMPQESSPAQYENIPRGGIPVRRSLWEGKTPEAICTDMRKENVSNEVIGHILFYKLENLSKRKVGELLYGPNKSEWTYSKKGKQLFDEAALISIIDIND